MPAGFGERIGLRFAETPLHLIPQGVKSTIAAVGIAARTPEIRHITIGRIDQFVLLVIAGQETDLEGMRTNDLREVVLQDVELFIVMPRSLGPEGIRIGAVPETTPESRITALQAVMLVREGKVQGGRNGCRNLIIQTRVGSGTI